ncbi:MAG TPA: tRNA epoxyqueuosine(34) reductase QueG [Spirochaetes bacterium]|nr:tRNA epoxyqueuosine(34) reductase QueG [Spirochaetota bacterium]
MHQITRDIKMKANEIGFDLVGICEAEELDDYKHYQRWIEKGFHGEMDYLPRRTAHRKSPKTLMESAKTVISCALNYYHPTVEGDFDHGMISNYARNLDYHKIMSNMLKELADFIQKQNKEALVKYYCDTGPILEKAYSQQSGIGWIGKNTCVINQKIGSWIFLGEILCSLPLNPDPPAKNYCGTCRLCIDICPTEAIVAPYQLDSRKCISYLTIELRDTIPIDLRKDMGHHLFGCDLCQSVCPWNRNPPESPMDTFYPRQDIRNRSLEEWLDLDEEGFRSIFKQNPVKRTKWMGFMRNVIVVAGNSRDHKLIGKLEGLYNLNNTLLSEHLDWAIDRLESSK